MCANELQMLGFLFPSLACIRHIMHLATLNRLKGSRYRCVQELWNYYNAVDVPGETLLPLRSESGVVGDEPLQSDQSLLYNSLQ